jgi:hypothetical protein
MVLILIFGNYHLCQKLAKLHTKYLLAKRLFCFFLFVFLSCVLCLAISLLFLKNLCKAYNGFIYKLNFFIHYYVFCFKLPIVLKKSI